jgi:hypothetical protein
MPLAMKRRRFVQALIASPALPALSGQQPAPGVPANPAPGIPLNPTQPVQPPARAGAELPKIDIVAADVGAEPVLHFFNPRQFSALQRLSDLLMPAVNNTPGALDAKAPEFLDFLMSQSPKGDQQLYVTGLDALNTQAHTRFKQDFATLDASSAAEILAPLHQPWTYNPPADPLAKFLREAKQDIRTATVNSREYTAHAPGGSGRRSGSTGLYWHSLD